MASDEAKVNIQGKGYATLGECKISLGTEGNFRSHKITIS